MSQSRLEGSGAGVTVVVVDSGWDRRIPDSRVAHGRGFVHPDDDLSLALSDDDDDRLGHGTMCTKLILAIAPDARVIPFRIFGSRQLEASVVQLEAALLLAAESAVDVVSLSLATVQVDAVPRLYAACARVVRSGASIVAAADARTSNGYPAVFDNVIGVRAGAGDRSLDFRFVGGPIDVEARGVVNGVTVDVRYPRTGVNSVAAARVAGIVARCRERNPRASVADVRDWLAMHSVSSDMVHA